MVRDEGELARQMPAVARLVLGSPNKALSSEREWRYRRKGSLSVDLRRGVWRDYEEGTGGGVLDLVRVTQTLSSSRAAADWLKGRGVLQNDRRARPDKAHELHTIQRSPSASNGEASGAPGAEPPVYWSLDGAPEETRGACAIWRDSTPLSHPDAAPAVAYLTSRGLSPPYPETLAFAVLPHSRTGEVLPTLIVARHCPVVGMVRGIHRIFLDYAGGKYRGGTAKMSLGPIAGGRAELLWQSHPERLLIAEGVETTLSAARLFGYGAAWAMCGGFPRELILRPWHQHVLLVADNDKSGTSVKKARALARWIVETGRSCEVQTPLALGADANDVAQSIGLVVSGTHDRATNACEHEHDMDELAAPRPAPLEMGRR